MTDSYYLPVGAGRYRSTEHTVGPWSAEAQHFGPPSALLVRELERCAPRAGWTLTRVCVEVLGPLPVAEVEVSARVERPGRSVELLTAELLVGGRPAASARAWRMVTSDTAAVAHDVDSRLPDPESTPPMPFQPGWGGGYLHSVEWRTVRGGLEPGDAVVWARPTVPTVADEKPTPLQRLFTVVDSASGVSSRLDVRRWLFINADLTVHLHREPVGDWVGLDAATVIGPHGAGTATSIVHDVDGPVGRSAQTLLVRPHTTG